MTTDLRFIFWTSIILLLHIILSVMTVQGFGLSITTVVAAPAMFVFIMSLTEQTATVALMALALLYRFEVREAQMV